MRLRVRPSRAVSVLGMVTGGIMTFLGVVEVIPTGVGWFGYLWTIIAACITIYYAYNLFSREGISVMEIEVMDGKIVRKK